NEIQRAKVVGHDRVGADIVTMNSRVRFVDETSGREMVLTLVYPDKAGTEGTISVLAPVGIALLGLRKGQRIDWTSPNGRPLKLRIIDIEYQPEANGDFHLYPRGDGHQVSRPLFRFSYPPADFSISGASWPSSSSARSVQCSPSSALTETPSSLKSLTCLTRLPRPATSWLRSEEHTSELQSRENLVCRLRL